MRLSIIVPFHKRIDYLERCLEPLRKLGPDTEIIVVADGAHDDCAALVGAAGGRLLEIPGPVGPAVGRNRGAQIALGEILIFVDSDVVVSPESVSQLDDQFRRHPEIAAVFGAYDEFPAEPNFLSQYKNLAHSYIHQSSSTEAQTFWAGFGAVRRAAFWAVGGFDERFARPSVEDIDLGYRLTAAGHRVRLESRIRVQHLKKWTFRSVLLTDVRDRGIPWTQLIHRSARTQNDLNLRSAYRISVVLAYGLLAALAATMADARWGLVAGADIVLLYPLNRRFYRFFRQRRGLWFALRVVPLHFLYHLYNGFSFAVGTLLYLLHRYTGFRLPGALPLSPWPAPSFSIRQPEPEVRSVNRADAVRH